MVVAFENQINDFYAKLFSGDSLVTLLGIEPVLAEAFGSSFSLHSMEAP